jgi:hypothetical protein
VAEEEVMKEAVVVPEVIWKKLLLRLLLARRWMWLLVMVVLAEIQIQLVGVTEGQVPSPQCQHRVVAVEELLQIPTEVLRVMSLCEKVNRGDQVEVVQEKRLLKMAVPG